MRIVVAMDSFKGSLRAGEACDAVRRGIVGALPDADVTVCPMADGGEGTALAVMEACGGERIECNVEGPLPGMRVTAGYVWLSDVGPGALVEMAEASGLALLDRDELDPLRTTTFGTGELSTQGMARDRRERHCRRGCRRCQGSGLAFSGSTRSRRRSGRRRIGGHRPDRAARLSPRRRCESRGPMRRRESTSRRARCGPGVRAPEGCRCGGRRALGSRPCEPRRHDQEGSRAGGENRHGGRSRGWTRGGRTGLPRCDTGAGCRCGDEDSGARRDCGRGGLGGDRGGTPRQTVAGREGRLRCHLTRQCGRCPGRRHCRAVGPGSARCPGRRHRSGRGDCTHGGARGRCARTRRRERRGGGISLGR
ncbi:MAG TPA: hypothetical protein EYQ27_20270 [Gemmatimonadetes bacterium]|nr:hypothetical protein [Gemmatimonadota bacterium]